MDSQQREDAWQQACRSRATDMGIRAFVAVLVLDGGLFLVINSVARNLVADETVDSEVLQSVEFLGWALPVVVVLVGVAASVRTRSDLRHQKRPFTKEGKYTIEPEWGSWFWLPVVCGGLPYVLYFGAFITPHL